MEKQVIQSVGFRNIKDDSGNVTGFQFKVRLPYYRGIFLSQIRPGTLYIDGVFEGNYDSYTEAAHAYEQIEWGEAAVKALVSA